MPITTPTKSLCTARLLGWSMASLLVAAALGWLASEVSGVWSPMLIFPLLIGGLLGAMLVVLMRVCHVHAAWVVYSLAILAVAVVVVSQHWLAYHEMVRAVNEDVCLLQRAAAQLPNQFQGQIPTPPADVIAFMNDEACRARKVPTWFGEVTLQGSVAWTFWGVDALLVLLPVLFLLRQGRARKWCPTCCSWYRVTRKGRLSLADAESLLALLEEDASSNVGEAKEGDGQRFATFMISDCDGRCDKAELAILIPAKSVFNTRLLDRDQRRTVEAFLDGDRQ